MNCTKYAAIYAGLKSDIETGRYPYGGLLPSEAALVEQYGSVRNTVRRAIAMLVEDGWLLPRRGKGVFVIYEKRERPQIILNGIETLKEFAVRTGRVVSTRVLAIDTRLADGALARRSLFPVGTPLAAVVRVRYVDGVAQIIDHNFFLQTVAAGLTKELAEDSIYDFLEHTTGLAIVARKQKITVARADKLDKKHLALDGLNCVAVLSHQVYDSDGRMFEYTESRHNPLSFVFHNSARRSPQRL
ncbi:MAG: UTRA domain-containing protein [Spirochaetaceae bacterium]|jgi:GntR family trehalose operon transcriptional repressor|nr:UTRA domain-containing protein [Spirochaetaceae bacterium]